MDTIGIDTLRERTGICPIFSWDTSEIFQNEVEYRMDEEGMSEEEAVKLASYGDYSFEWECFIECVQEWLDKQETDMFFISAQSLGWRNHSGYKILSTDDAAEFVRGLVGFDCDYTIRCFSSETSLLTASVYHHDSPTGESREVYSFEQYTNEGVKSFSLQTLQKFLSGWLDANDESYHYLCDIEEVTDLLDGKERRNFTKDDFCTIIWEMYKEETLTESETLGIEDTIKYYVNCTL